MVDVVDGVDAFELAGGAHFTMRNGVKVVPYYVLETIGSRALVPSDAVLGMSLESLLIDVIVVE